MGLPGVKTIHPRAPAPPGIAGWVPTTESELKSINRVPSTCSCARANFCTNLTAAARVCKN